MEHTPLLSGGTQDGLPPPNGVEQDHPIFLRVCHSPWPWLSQNVLCYVRGALLTYLLVTAAMSIDFKTEGDRSVWRIFFQFSSITGFLLILYHAITFSWTLVHLHWPELEDGYDNFAVAVIKFLSPPEQRPHSSNRFFFSLFYTTVHVAAFMNTLIFWAILVPSGRGHLPGDGGKPEVLTASPTFGPDDFDLGAEGWFKPFVMFNLYITPTLIALVEIIFLNSIKRQVPVPSHIFALQFLAALYIGWAAVGIVLTGHDPYFWLDPDKVGSREGVFAYCIGFIALAPGFFSFMYGLIGMRESVVERLGYNQESET